MATEFKGFIGGTTDRSVVMDATQEEHRHAEVKPIRQASFEIVTDGPYPHDRLASLAGRRVRVTILD